MKKLCIITLAIIAIVCLYAIISKDAWWHSLTLTACTGLAVIFTKEENEEKSK